MTSATLLWMRRDLRLADHPALRAALARGGPVIPVFIRDESVDRLGAAPALRLGLALAAFGAALERLGSRLVLRSGPAAQVLDALIAETGADAVVWTRRYEPDGIGCDRALKAALKARGVTAESHSGALLFEPWEVATGQGGPYRVFTPFWRNIRGRDPGLPLRAPAGLPAPAQWPASERLDDWRLGASMRRGAAVVAAACAPGEAAALSRLDGFVADRLARYEAGRDFFAEDATSGLSEPLAWGEIGPRQIWAAGMRARAEGMAGAEAFLRQLAWRDFAWHLAFHTPELLGKTWRPGWEDFPWSCDPTAPEVIAWRQGRTGEPLVDAAMRELWVTGRMHNRARMIAASYLTKHLMVHWKIGAAVFADMLVDWDPASNAMGWQWVAGSGPDAAPFFRVFNPAGQAAKFDPSGHYRRRWIAEGQTAPPATARRYFEVVPRRWALDPAAACRAPIVDLAAGRARSLAAYRAHRQRAG